MTIQVEVVKIWDETREIRCLELVPLDGEPLGEISAGGHIDLHVGDGLIRQYSLWNGPDDRTSYFVGVMQEAESRGGSTAVHALKLGDKLTESAPKNNFALAEGEGPHLLMAGGIGITPLLFMARTLAGNGTAYHLHAFARSADFLPFAERLAKDTNASAHLGVNPPELNDLLIGLLSDNSPQAHVYMCGPGPFMELVKETAAKCGWADDHVHLEYFSVDPDSVETDGDSFEVELQESGVTLTIGPDQTIIEAMEDAGLDPVTSCEQGVCGTCLCDIVEGEADHRDQYLNAVEREAGKQFLPCISRAKGKRLVLKL